MAKNSLEIKGFRPIDQIPYPILHDQAAVASRLQHQLLEVLGGISIRRGTSSAEHRITLGDLKTTPADLTYEQFVSYFTEQLSLEKSTLSSVNKNAALIININSAMHAARGFISGGLGLVLDEDATRAQVHSLKDVYEIIRQTSLFAKDKGLVGPGRLNKQASFCLLVLETISALELQKTEYAELSADSEKIKKMFVSAPTENCIPFFHAVGNPGEDSTLVVPNPTISKSVDLQRPMSIRYRDKTFQSIMLKLGRKPEAQFDSRSAVLDEVGFEIRIPQIKTPKGPERDIHTFVKTIAEMVAYLVSERGAKKVEIHNWELITREQCRQIERLLRRKKILFGKQVTFTSDTQAWLDIPESNYLKENKTSSASFQSLKFTCTLTVPVGHGSKRERNIEVQFADEVSTAHDLDADHRIYKVVQYVSYMTRRFGGCSEEWILWKLNTALNEPGPRIGASERQILSMLTEKGRIVSMPGIKKKRLYADPSVFRRTLGAGLYDKTEIPDIVGKLDHASRGRKRAR